MRAEGSIPSWSRSRRRHRRYWRIASPAFPSARWTRTSAREPFAERLERAQTQLPEALALDQHPVVVPVRKQVADERLGIRLGAAPLGAAVDLVAREPLGGGEVDANVSA